MVQPGDIVRYLNSVGGGEVVRVEGNIAIVDDEGFETPVQVRECVVVGHRSAEQPKLKPQPEKTAVQASKVSDTQQRVSSGAKPMAEEPEIDTSEVEGGDSLNVQLAFEPVDIKAIPHTTYEATLVNDSNFYLYFTLLTRADEDGDAGWLTRYAGIVEPNVQVLVGEFSTDDLPKMDRVAVQYIAFKRNRQSTLKAPASVEYKLDTTRFFKLHAFRENIYFDTPVIALDIVRDDLPITPQARVNARDLEREMNRKIGSDMREKHTRRPVVKKKKTHQADAEGKIVVDLHINELLDTTRGLSPADILNYQVDEFRRVMDENIRNHGQKIIFIHGKGEGVLRNALVKELNYRYKGHLVQDASFAEYGFGATQVTIR